MVFPLQVGNIAENQFWGSAGGIGKKQWKTDTWITLTVPFRLSAKILPAHTAPALRTVVTAVSLQFLSSSSAPGKILASPSCSQC